MYDKVSYRYWHEQDAIDKFELDYPGKRILHCIKRYSGVNPSQCINDNRIVKGARYWVSKYYIYQYEEIDIDSITGEETYIGMRFADAEETKSESIDRAIELTIQTQKPHTVRIVKILKDESNIISNHWVKNKSLSCWDIFYTDLPDEELITVGCKVAIKSNVPTGIWNQHTNTILTQAHKDYFQIYGPLEVKSMDYNGSLSFDGILDKLYIDLFIKVPDD